MTIEERVAQSHYPVPLVRTLESAVEEVALWKIDFAVKYDKLIGEYLAEALCSPIKYIRYRAEMIMIHGIDSRRY